MTYLDEIYALIEAAKRDCQIDIVVISSNGTLSVSAMRKDDLRFYVAKRNDVAAGADHLVAAVESVRDEIVAEVASWEAGQPGAA